MKIIITFLFLFSGCCIYSPRKDHSNDIIPLVAIIANIQEYHGKRVHIQSVCSFKPECFVAWLSPDDRDLFLRKNGIWLDMIDSYKNYDLLAFRDKYEEKVGFSNLTPFDNIYDIWGTVNAKYQGHGSMFLGSINIDKIMDPSGEILETEQNKRQNKDRHFSQKRKDTP